MRQRALNTARFNRLMRRPNILQSEVLGYASVEIVRAVAHHRIWPEEEPERCGFCGSLVSDPNHSAVQCAIFAEQS